ncbi:MAG TPA: hypothetical protein EYP57_03935 [Thermodesulfobacteriaceae bacterium]|nr:hypothetical protein [Thermodesulfobacteriaceae bacterium]
MELLRKYIDRELNLKHVKDTDMLTKYGITCRHLPDPPEVFDEFEFGIDFYGSQDAAFVVTVEKMRIVRMLFGFLDSDNPDILRPLPEERLELLVKERGRELQEFFDFISQ